MRRPDKGLRYDMPVVFGKSNLPNISTVDRIKTLALSFATDPDALRRYIPYHFRLPDTEAPIVTVSSSMNIGVDHMGGRQYNVVRAMTDVVARNVDGSSFTAPYHLVIWENAVAPIIAGREFQGYAKVGAEIPDHEMTEDGGVFRLRDNGVELLTGEITDARPATGVDLGKLSATPAYAVGWKYIPGPGNVADADYPTKLVAYREVFSMRYGVGALGFGNPSWQDSPISARIIDALKALPVVEMKRGVISEARSRLARDEVERIPSIEEGEPERL